MWCFRQIPTKMTDKKFDNIRARSRMALLQQQLCRRKERKESIKIIENLKAWFKYSKIAILIIREKKQSSIRLWRV